MQENPHHNGVLREGDIDFVLGRFEEEFKYTLFGRKFTLDASAATVEDTMAEFVDKIEPLLTEDDRSRILTHRALWKGE